MNKVVSIELAGQMFWIEEEAFKGLEVYLGKIKQQLYGRQFADDILGDIEHRLAELLFELAGSGKTTITGHQLDSVIAQIGYLDSDDLETETSRKSYLDPRNRILAGVCAGLARRLQVPVLLVRLLFIVLTFAFGLGLVAYLVLWISLDTDRTRNSHLTAQGRAPTAKLIATVDERDEGGTRGNHAFIFFPFRLIGKLLSVLRAEYSRHRDIYINIFRFICAVLLILLLVLIGRYLLNFSERRLFIAPINWVMIISVVLITIVSLTAVIQKYLLHYATLRHKNILLCGALVPLIVLISGVIYLEDANTFEHTELIEKHYAIDSNPLELAFNENEHDEGYQSSVKIVVSAKNNQEEMLSVSVRYSSRGENIEDALKNIHEISYLYSVPNNVIHLNRYLSLKQGSLYRGQAVMVLLEIPQGVQFVSPRPLVIRRDLEGYHYEISDESQETVKYLANSGYLHEFTLVNDSEISQNESFVLKDKYCEEYFVGEVWNCESNLRVPAKENRFLNPMFHGEGSIEKIRLLLRKHGLLTMQELVEIQSALSSFSTTGNRNNSFVNYVDYLIALKSR